MGKLYHFVFGTICTFFIISSAGQDYNQLDAFLHHLEKENKFTGSVLIAKGDSVVYNKGFGQANAEGTLSNSYESQYLIGSITKTFTAIGILQLFEEGKLSLSDPLSKYFPLFPNAEKITLRHLLMHKSGIKNYTQAPDLMSWKGKELQPFALIEKVIEQPLAFEPGTMHSYSNTNYVLLGMILQQVSETTFEKYVSNFILKPIGLRQTGINRKKAKTLSEGLYLNGSNWSKADYVDPSVPFSAGNLYSSTGDLYKFSKAFFKAKLFKNTSTFELMTNFDEGFYALGIYAEEVDEQIFIGHNGSIDGYSSVWCYFRELDLHVILLSNAMDSSHDDVLDAIVHAHLGEEVVIRQPKEAIDLSVEKLEQYVGIYQIQRGFDIHTFIQNDGLFAQATGQGAFELFPENDSLFFATVTDIEVIFQNVQGGKAQKITFFQGGGSTEALRKTEELKAITLSLTELKVLEGTYLIQEGFELSVFVENEKLFALATGQEAFQLIPASRQDFFTDGLGIEISFVFDENGESIKLSLYQGGSKIDAEKKE